MFINRFVFVMLTFLLMLLLLATKIHPIIAGAITLVIMMTGLMTISSMQSKKRLSLLNDDCDPEAFVEKTKKQRIMAGKNPKLHTYFDVDLAAGLIACGRFEEAKQLLLSIDKDRFSSKNDSLLVYSINLMLCLYELGDTESAEEIYNTQVSVATATNSSIAHATKVLAAQRFLFLGKYNESREQFNKIRDQKFSKRTQMGILYSLAQIDEKTGNIEAAMEKYKRVASEGNKLWIAQKAREKLDLK